MQLDACRKKIGQTEEACKVYSDRVTAEETLTVPGFESMMRDNLRRVH
jgi:hypothetical protein